jgi:hypothetical protein
MKQSRFTEERITTGHAWYGWRDEKRGKTRQAVRTPKAMTMVDDNQQILAYCYRQDAES